MIKKITFIFSNLLLTSLLVEKKVTQNTIIMTQSKKLKKIIILKNKV